MEILDRLTDFKRLWSIAISGVGVPPDPQVLRWLERFDDVEVQYAVMRLGKKSRFQSFASDEAASRYLTGILIGESRRTQGVSV